MDMTGEYRIAAPRDRVWAALNDPEVLKASIPGCEELVKTSDTEFTAKVRARVGPVSAGFTGKVTLSDLDPPSSYRISGEGQGGAAGFAKGGAEVNLSDDGSDTLLRYKVNATVGGKLAQIGSRLIDSTARKMADDFFGRFTEQVQVAPAVEAAPAAAEPAPPMAASSVTPPPVAAAPSVTAPPATGGIPMWAWIVAVVVFVVALLLLFGR